MLRKSQVLSLPATERDKIVEQITQEIKIQSYLRHPNLIQLYDFFSDESNLYLFMELACDGQLFELLEQRGCLSEETTSIVVREIARGIHYMHSKMVIHRDIKLENIVLTHVDLSKFREWPKFAISGGPSSNPGNSGRLSAALRSICPLKCCEDASTTTKLIFGLWALSPMNCTREKRPSKSTGTKIWRRS
jgi:serine/threonine protein kinase